MKRTKRYRNWLVWWLQQKRKERNTVSLPAEDSALVWLDGTTYEDGGTTYLQDKISHTVTQRTRTATPTARSAPAANGGGNSYYVDSSAADDTGAGTQTDPWKYIPGQSSSTNTGTVSSGDVVYCIRGGEWNEQLSCVDGVMYDAYGTGDDPHIDVSAATGANEACLYGINLPTTTVKNFTLTGSGEMACVKFIGTSGGVAEYGIWVENCTITNLSTAGDDDEHDGVSTDTSAEVHLENCDISDCRDIGANQAVTAHGASKIYMNGGSISGCDVGTQNVATSEVTIVGVTISNLVTAVAVPSESTATATLIFDNCDIDVANGEKFISAAGAGSVNNVMTFRNCDIDITSSTDGFLRGITLNFEDNDIYVNDSNFELQSTITANVINSSGNTWRIVNTDNGIFESSITGEVFNFSGDTFPDHANEFIVVNSGSDAIVNFSHCVFTGGSLYISRINSGFAGAVTLSNCVAYNSNEFNVGYLIRNSMGSGDSGTLIATNNIFYEYGDCINGTEKRSVSYNCYYEVTDCDDLGGTGSITDDPKFTDPTNGDFTLKSTSPCLNAGADPFSDGDGDQYDFVGNKVWDDTYDTPDGYWILGVDMGAYSSTGSAQYGYHFSIESGTSWADYVIKAPLAPELLAADSGVDDLFNGSGVANEIDATDRAGFTGDQFYFATNRGLVVYDADLTGDELAKADKYFGIT